MKFIGTLSRGDADSVCPKNDQAVVEFARSASRVTPSAWSLARETLIKSREQRALDWDRVRNRQMRGIAGLWRA
ncbi:MAG: hypothetical protein EAZ37_00035, partial [Burkholderiales bacterium]